VNLWGTAATNLARCEEQNATKVSEDVDFLGRLLAGAPLLDQTAYDAERVVNRALAFVEDELVAAHRKDADRAPSVLHTGDSDHFRPIVVRLLHQIGISKVIFAKCLDVHNRLASHTLCYEIDLITFHVFDDEDVETPSLKRVTARGGAGWRGNCQHTRGCVQRRVAVVFHVRKAVRLGARRSGRAGCGEERWS
jgi:hypothetical protein